MICGHAPQIGSLEEKQSVYDEAKCKLDMHSTGDLAIIIIIMVIFKCYFSGELIALS